MDKEVRASFQETRLIHRSASSGRLQPKSNGQSGPWPWPSLSFVPRRDEAYQAMIQTFRHLDLPQEFHRIVDVGQDRGQSLMWVKRLTNQITSVDIDQTMIDLSLANYRVDCKHHAVQPTVVDTYCLPEHSLISPDQPEFTQTDLIKIDAGARTLFVLEALDQVLANSNPTVFVYIDHLVSPWHVEQFLVDSRGYTTVDPAQVHTFMCFVHPSRLKATTVEE